MMKIDIKCEFNFFYEDSERFVVCLYFVNEETMQFSSMIKPGEMQIIESEIKITIILPSHVFRCHYNNW